MGAHIRKLTAVASLPVLTIGLAVLSVLFFDSIELFRRPYQTLIVDYRHALTQSRNRLVGLTYDLAADRTLIEHLAQGRYHGVQQSLYVGLKPGQLDKIALFDERCAKIASASLVDDGFISSCDQNFNSGFRWQTFGGLPYFQLIRPVFILDKPYILVAGLTLDSNWLNIYPDLAASFRRLNIKINSFAAGTQTFAIGLLSAEGRETEQPVYAASLMAQGRLAWLLAPLLRLATPMSNVFFWPLIFLALGSWILSQGLARRRKETDAQDRKAFLSWCESLGPDRVANENFTRFVGGNGEYYAYCQKSILGRIKASLDTQNHQRSVNQSLSEELAVKEDTVKTLKQKLIDLYEHESLALQIKQSAQVFSGNLNHMEAQLGKLQGLVQGSLLKESTQLFEQAKVWKLGISKRGARKFIRSLYESAAGEESAQENLLAEHLEFFVARTMAISDQVVQCSLQLGKMRPNFTLYGQVLAYWYALALKDDWHQVGKNNAIHIIDVVKTALGLVNANGVPLGVKFWDLNLDPVSLNMPTAILSAALYHALNHLVEAGNESIEHCSLRKRQNLYFLNFRLSSFKTSESRYLHRDMADGLLSTYGGASHLIPGINNKYVFSISWPVEWHQSGSKNNDSSRVSISH